MAILGLYNKSKSTYAPTQTSDTYSKTVFKNEQTRANKLVTNSLTKTALSLPQTTAKYLSELLNRAKSRTL